MEVVEAVQQTSVEELPLPADLRRVAEAVSDPIRQDDSDGGSDPGDDRAPVPPGCVARPVFRYHAVVNSAVEAQLVALLASPCTLYFLVSAPYAATTQGHGPTYREVYMHLTLPIESVRVAMPAVPNIGYVWGEFQASFQPDYDFERRIQQLWSGDRV